MKLYIYYLSGPTTLVYKITLLEVYRNISLDGQARASEDVVLSCGTTYFILVFLTH